MVHISCCHNENRSLCSLTLNAFHISVTKSSTLWKLVCSCWASMAEGGKDKQDALPPKLPCRNSCGNVPCPTHICSKNCLLVLALNRQTDLGSVLKLPWLNMKELWLTAAILPFSICWEWVTPNQSLHSWALVLFGRQLSQQSLQWSALTLHPWQEIRSKHKITFNRIFCMVTRIH